MLNLCLKHLVFKFFFAAVFSKHEVFHTADIGVVGITLRMSTLQTTCTPLQTTAERNLYNKAVRPGSDVELFMSRPKLLRAAELIQTPILIAAELSSKGEKCSFRQTTYKIRYNQ